MQSRAPTAWARTAGWRLLRALPYLLPALAIDLLFLQGVAASAKSALCPIIDDVFIHFQYARSFAEGHPLSYHPGELPTTGATSPLYAILLAPGWWLGFRGLGMTAFAHGLAVASLAVMLRAAKGLGDALLGPPAGLVAAVAALACPSFDFLAVGGMEVAVAAACHVGAVAVAVAWLTAPDRGVERTVRGAWAVAAVGACAALARPEAGAAACAAALALAAGPVPDRPRTRLLALVAVLPAGFPALVALATTGDTATSGMLLKWIPADPYQEPAQKLEAVTANLGELWSRLMAGEPHTHVLPWPILPAAYRPLLLVGYPLVVAAAIRRHRWRGVGAALALVGASLAVVFPVTYTWFGNLGRYVLNYVPLTLIVCALGGVVVGRAIQRLLPAARPAPAVVGVLVALLLVESPRDARREPVKAATQICEQHVDMAREVRKLPDDAVVGINDAGALAFLGGHRTWDLVGLTSPRAARANRSGPGSVFERLERLPPARRPTHLAYYPPWFPTLDITGRLLHAEIAEGLYVGRRRKELRPVRTELYGSGAKPVLADPAGELVDALDVADVHDEAAHDYVIEGARREEAVFRRYPVDGRDVADGGRPLRRVDRFVLRARAGEDATWVLRTDAWYDTRLALRWNGAPLETLEVRRRRRWVERTVHVPAERVQRRNRVERRVVGPRDVGLFHDWLYQ